MKKIIFVIVLCFYACICLDAQETSSQDYLNRYNALVKAGGYSGLGINTLVDKWIHDFPDEYMPHRAKFMSYLLSSKNEKVTRMNLQKYLGQEPVITLRDSTGKPVNYFREVTYDDNLFAQAIKEIDKAILLSPLNLELRLSKITALCGYEKDSPDMAVSSLNALIDYNFTQSPKWTYPGVEKVDEEFFSALVQEYCYTFFRYASSESGYASFKSVSERMLSYRPNDILFLDNLGSYYLVYEKNNKVALKYYNKVLKKKPDDMTAIKNCIILARTTKNKKLEKKYLPKFIKFSTDTTAVEAAKLRLKSILN